MDANKNIVSSPRKSWKASSLGQSLLSIVHDHTHTVQTAASEQPFPLKLAALNLLGGIDLAFINLIPFNLKSIHPH